MHSIPIIYEDDDIIAVNKPAGVEAREIEAQLAPRLTRLAHRLDRDTSGVLLLAKHERAREYLKYLFQERKIKKTYIALVEGVVKEKEGVIDLPIGRSRRHPSRRVAGVGLRGTTRQARTLWRVKKYFSRDQYTLLMLFPRTGRTHQIRVHLKAFGHPVACDALYLAKRACPVGLARQFLHAYALEFIAPSGGKIRLEAELPRDLQNTLDALS
jgi:23S rRNA pseudouridine1911/1915/1917 synthase